MANSITLKYQPDNPLGDVLGNAQEYANNQVIALLSKIPSASGTLVTDSYLNSKFVELQNNTVLLTKIGKMVTCVLDGVPSGSFSSATELLSNTYASYRPKHNAFAIVSIYKSSSDCPVGNAVVQTDGKMMFYKMSSISARTSVASGYYVYGTLCWITN